MDDQRQEAQDGVRFRVWSGDAADEIFEIVCDEVFDGECADEDEAWFAARSPPSSRRSPRE